MWGFILGVAVTVAVIANAAAVRRGIARGVLIASGYAAMATAMIYRTSKKTAEDFRDAFAEVRAERAQAAEAGDSVQSSLQELKREIEALRGEISKFKT